METFATSVLLDESFNMLVADTPLSCSFKKTNSHGRVAAVTDSRVFWRLLNRRRARRWFLALLDFSVGRESEVSLALSIIHPQLRMIASLVSVLSKTSVPSCLYPYNCPGAAKQATIAEECYVASDERYCRV